MKLVITGPAILAVVLVAALTLSCNRAEEKPQLATQSRQAATPPTTALPGGAMMRQFRAGCPMLVEGAEVSVSDTDRGVAFTFTAGDGDMSALRERVQHMARMYEMHRGHRQMMWHQMGPRGEGRHRGPGVGKGHMSRRGPMPAAKAKVTNLQDGARIELEPTDPSFLESLRQHARWHQKRMDSGECWMLQGQNSPEGEGTTGGNK